METEKEKQCYGTKDAGEYGKAEDYHEGGYAMRLREMGAGVEATFYGI